MLRLLGFRPRDKQLQQQQQQQLQQQQQMMAAHGMAPPGALLPPIPGHTLAAGVAAAAAKPRGLPGLPGAPVRAVPQGAGGTAPAWDGLWGGRKDI